MAANGKHTNSKYGDTAHHWECILSNSWSKEQELETTEVGINTLWSWCTENNGKSHVFMGSLTISLAMFNSELLVYQRIIDGLE